MPAAAVGQTSAMPTVQVANFTKLENQLNSAMAAGNSQQAAMLLTDDFEEWTPQPPGSPIARDEWLKRGNKSAAEARMRQMAVKDIGDHAIADFVLEQAGKTFFIVDVWQKQGAGWKLQQRYRAQIERYPAPKLPPRKD